jgi:hypothetical protein
VTLEHALGYGIWGGAMPEERQRAKWCGQRLGRYRMDDVKSSSFGIYISLRRRGTAERRTAWSRR